MLYEPCVLLLVWLMLVNLREIESLFFAVIVRIQIRTILVDELVVLSQPSNEILDLNACDFTNLFPFIGQKTCTSVRLPRAVVVYDDIHSSAHVVVVRSAGSLYESSFRQHLPSFGI